MSFEFIFGPKTSRGKKGKSLILGISCDFVTVNRWDSFGEVWFWLFSFILFRSPSRSQSLQLFSRVKFALWGAGSAVLWLWRFNCIFLFVMRIKFCGRLVCLLPSGVFDLKRITGCLTKAVEITWEEVWALRGLNISVLGLVPNFQGFL